MKIPNSKFDMQMNINQTNEESKDFDHSENSFEEDKNGYLYETEEMQLVDKRMCETNRFVQAQSFINDLINKSQNFKKYPYFSEKYDSYDETSNSFYECVSSQNEKEKFTTLIVARTY